MTKFSTNLTSEEKGQYIGVEQYQKLPTESISKEEYEIEVQILEELNVEYETARTLYNLNKSPENSLRVLEAGWKLRNYKPRNMVIIQ